MLFALLLTLARREKVIDDSKHERLFSVAGSAFVGLLAVSGIVVSAVVSALDVNDNAISCKVDINNLCSNLQISCELEELENIQNPRHIFDP